MNSASDRACTAIGGCVGWDDGGELTRPRAPECGSRRKPSAADEWLWRYARTPLEFDHAVLLPRYRVPVRARQIGRQESRPIARTIGSQLWMTAREDGPDKWRGALAIEPRDRFNRARIGGKTVVGAKGGWHTSSCSTRARPPSGPPPAPDWTVTFSKTNETDPFAPLRGPKPGRRRTSSTSSISPSGGAVGLKTGNATRKAGATDSIPSSACSASDSGH